MINKDVLSRMMLANDGTRLGEGFNSTLFTLDGSKNKKNAIHKIIEEKDVSPIAINKQELQKGRNL